MAQVSTWSLITGGKGGLAVRTAIKNCFDALRSRNSGANAPDVELVEGQEFLEVPASGNTRTLKVRIGNAWRDVWSVDAGTGVFTLLAGVTAFARTLLAASDAAAGRAALGVGEITGQIAFFARDTAPSGWLKANGSLVSRSAYGDLFAAIGTTYGAGDGSSTFRLPDLRGEFLRAWDDGRGVDASRVLGSLQSDSFRSHTHTVRFETWGRNHDTGASTRYDVRTSGTDGAVTTTATGDSETRPRNIALLACIKF
jgi:microcystin-dependent protein